MLGSADLGLAVLADSGVAVIEGDAAAQAGKPHFGKAHYSPGCQGWGRDRDAASVGPCCEMKTDVIQRSDSH